MSEAAVDEDCRNCGAPFAPERRRFCPECGQETRLRAPTLGGFVQQFGGAYFSTEGALWRTLGLLLFRPGQLTRHYLAGRRKHYVLPLRLYLTISLMAFIAMRAVVAWGPESTFKLDVDPQRDEFNIITLGDGRGFGMKDGHFYCTDLPAWVCNRLKHRIDRDPEGLQQEVARLGERFLSNVGAAMFVMLPLFALWQKIIYWGRRMRYTEHLVFALHLHAFWFAALMPMLASLPWLTGLAFTVMPAYTLLAMRRVYGGRWWPLLLRAALVSLLYMLTLSVVLVGVVLWLLVL